MNYLIDVLEAAGKELSHCKWNISELKKDLAKETKRADDAEATCRTLQETLEVAAAEAYAKKDSWKPKMNENYCNGYHYFGSDGSVVLTRYEGTFHDRQRVAYGNCAPTEEELRAKEPEILAALGLEKWEE